MVSRPTPPSCRRVPCRPSSTAAPTRVAAWWSSRAARFSRAVSISARAPTCSSSATVGSRGLTASRTSTYAPRASRERPAPTMPHSSTPMVSTVSSSAAPAPSMATDTTTGDSSGCAGNGTHSAPTRMSSDRAWSTSLARAVSPCKMSTSSTVPSGPIIYTSVTTCAFCEPASPRPPKG